MSKIIRTSSRSALRHVDRIVLTFNGVRYKFSIENELRIKRRDGEGALDLYQAERFAFWKRVLVEKRRARRDIERKYQEERDWKTVQVPELLRKEGMLRTESQVQANVRLQDGVGVLKEKLDNALYEEDLAQLMCDAFEHRRTVLMKVRNKGY